ncbi:MAG: hypothetical protein LBP33_04615 [Candidatus Adiutrix sp.]|jgi:hypothetical protein|nr:hypothetical protein [Candidatus Adiutrix sp.]
MKKIGLAVILGLLLAVGCGPRATESAYRGLLESYRGRHIDRLVELWGPPQASHTFADGQKLYSFSRTRRQYGSVQPVIGLGFGRRHVFGFGAYSPGGEAYVRDYSCETRVNTDRQGVILGFSYRGNDCLALEEAGPPAGASEAGTCRGGYCGAGS